MILADWNFIRIYLKQRLFSLITETWYAGDKFSTPLNDSETDNIVMNMNN